MKINLQRKFYRFHETIKLNDIQDNRDLRYKRDMLVEELQSWLRANGKPTVSIINQGSYAMGTGILPSGNRDYDIDVGLHFNLNIQDYAPVEVKKWVESALQRHNRTVEMKDPCVRVQYFQNGSPLYHVDLAIYGNGWNGLNIAKGRKGSQSQNKYWEVSHPKKLKELLKTKFNDVDERAQFKRVIRYLKKWKDDNFRASGNAAPTGIALTAMAYQWFSPCVTKYWNGEIVIDDLQALKNLLYRINQDWNCGLNVKLPVEPHNNLFEKLKESNNHVAEYKTKMSNFYQDVNNAFCASSNSIATKYLQRQFGNDFPS